MSDPDQVKNGTVKDCPSIRHLKVYFEDGKFAGWPANSGMWSWGNELLVGFALADHLEKASGHTYNSATARQKFVRSLDGGETWTIEDAYASGLVGQAKNHALGLLAVPPVEWTGSIDFTHPDFAMTLRRANDAGGAAHFYITTDRGHTWHGPYAFPNLGNPGILARTDYLIEGPSAMLAMLTASKTSGREGRVGCARTRDGGNTWQWVSWLDLEPDGFAIMPATVRISDSRLVCVVRRREAEFSWLAGYISDDNATSWRRVSDPVKDTGRGGNPPALIKLMDGRLCLAYAVRSHNSSLHSRICVRYSEDAGETWGGEVVLRGNDGANFDVGYPRMVQRLDGHVVIVYYYNHAWKETLSYRYIAATLFDPASGKRFD